MSEPGGRKENHEERSDEKWSAPLQDLHQQFIEWLQAEEGIIGWPMIENVRALRKGEFEEFVAYWKNRGIYIETHGNGGVGNLSLKATNSRKPVLVDGGGWFQVWTDRIDGLRKKSTKDLKAAYGEENEGLNRLISVGFHPGVWVDPDFEPVYISQHARDLLIQNAEKIERLVYLSSEKGSHSGRDIATYAIPAPFAFINENLTQQHIDAIYDGINSARADTRENLMAHMLRELSMAMPPEKLTPELIRSVFQKTQAIIGTESRDFGTYSRGPEREDPATLAKDVGEFIKVLGKDFDPKYLDAFIAHLDLVRGKSHYFIDHFGASFFVPARGEFLTPAEFEQCLSKVKDVLAVLQIKGDSSVLQGTLPHIVRTMHGEGTTGELFEEVCSQFKRFAAIPMEKRGSLVGAFESWSWSVDENGNAVLPVGDISKVIDEFEKMNAVIDPRHVKSFFSNLVTPTIRGNDGYLEPELLAQYRAEVERVTEANPQLLSRMLSHDWEIGILMHHSSDTMSPENFRRYIELVGSTPKDVFKTAIYIYSPTPKDVGPETLARCIAAAQRINAVAEKIGSKTPIEAVRDMVGHRGAGNDEKPVEEALRLVESYVTFLEAHTRRVKNLCPQISETNWSGGWEQQKALLREFVVKHGGEVTPRLYSSLGIRSY